MKNKQYFVFWFKIGWLRTAVLILNQKTKYCLNTFQKIMAVSKSSFFFRKKTADTLKNCAKQS